MMGNTRAQFVPETSTKIRVTVCQVGVDGYEDWHGSSDGPRPLRYMEDEHQDLLVVGQVAVCDCGMRRWRFDGAEWEVIK